MKNITDLTSKIITKSNYKKFYKDIAFMFKEFNAFYYNSDFKFNLKRKKSGIDFLSLAKNDFKDIKDKSIYGKIFYDKDKPVAYIFGFVYEGYPYLQESRVGYVDGVFVVEEYRGHGLGEGLIKDFILFCKESKADVVKLNVKSENTRAKELYEEIGFKLFDYTMTMGLK